MSSVGTGRGSDAGQARRRKARKVSRRAEERPMRTYFVEVITDPVLPTEQCTALPAELSTTAPLPTTQLVLGPSSDVRLADLVQDHPSHQGNARRSQAWKL